MALHDAESVKLAKSGKILLLSFVWMLGIGLFHAGGCGAYDHLLADFRVGGVSFFFVVSGYFFMKHYGERPFGRWWGLEIVKRMKSLGLPLIAWFAIGSSQARREPACRKRRENRWRLPMVCL